MMFPGGIERALGIVEISEWFDWMRREIPGGGIVLPHEETAASFAGHALRLRDRIRDVYRHLPASLENRLIESVIVYQCWELQKDLYANAKWPKARQSASMVTVEAERYIRPVGNIWGYHLVVGRDGFSYVVTVPTGFDSETVPATEMICNRLSRLLGLAVPEAAVVVVEQVLLNRNRDARPGRDHLSSKRAPELCVGFRYHAPSAVDALPLHDQHLSPRSSRQLLGALVLDIWTLKLATRRWSSAFSEVTGRVELTLMGGGGLAGGDWQMFLGSTSASTPSPQAIAPDVKRWSQIGPWFRKISQLDLNPIWELVFQMPPQWYGGRRRLVAEVLDKLESRKWGLQSATRGLAREGYLPGLKMPPSGSQVGIEAEMLRRSA
ncbi:MAG: hypothetical protein WCA49_09395 [Candidatus Sulfotelmatobacter sp.]